MLTLRTRMILAVWALWTQTGCNNTPAEPLSTSAQVSSPVFAVSDVRAMKMVVPDRTDDDIIRRANGIVNSIHGAPFEKPMVVDRKTADGYTETGLKVPTYRLHVGDSAHSSTHVFYDSGTDTIDVRNGNVDPTRHGPSDVAEVVARATAAAAFSTLGFGKTTGPARIDFTEASVRPRRKFEAASDGSSYDAWIDQYQFFAPLRVDGVAVRQGARDLGVLVAVHRTGVIARILIDAVGVATNEVGALLVGGLTSASLRSSDAEQEATVGFPNAVAESVGLRYNFEVGGNVTFSTPRLVYRVHSNIVENGVVLGRTKAINVAYRVDSVTPVREVFPGPSGPLRPSDTK